jgi:hypothetical protein
LLTFDRYNPATPMPGLQRTPMRQRSYTTSADITATPPARPHSRDTTGSLVPDLQPGSLETLEPPPPRKPKGGSARSAPKGDAALQYLQAAIKNRENTIADIDGVLEHIGIDQTISIQRKG